MATLRSERQDGPRELSGMITASRHRLLEEAWSEPAARAAIEQIAADAAAPARHHTDAA